MVLHYLMTLNSVVNPWIYMLFNKNLVESLKAILCPCLGQGSRPVSPNNPLGNTRRFICMGRSRDEVPEANGGNNALVVNSSIRTNSTSRSRKQSRSPPQETQVTFCRLTPTRMV